MRASQVPRPLQRSSLQRQWLVFPLTQPPAAPFCSMAIREVRWAVPLPPSPHPALHPALRALGCGQSLNLAQLQAGGDPQRPHVRARGWGAGGGFVLCAVFTHAEKRAPSLETVDPDHLQELREHTPALSQLSPDRGGLAPQSAIAVLRTPGLHPRPLVLKHLVRRSDTWVQKPLPALRAGSLEPLLPFKAAGGTNCERRGGGLAHRGPPPLLGNATSWPLPADRAGRDGGP